MSSRREAAILFSDIYKFTQKMEQDEELMMQQLHHHNWIFENLTKKFNGRIVKTTGDGFLIEFAYSVDAVLCAVNVQSALYVYNQDKPSEEKILVRIGLNAGEVRQRGVDIFGTGVNIASRLEQIAEPGSIFISQNLYDSIKDEINIQADSVGPIILKHIVEPVNVLKIEITEDLIESNLKQLAIEKINESESTESEADKAKPESIGNQIAVLPFKVLSSNKEDEYLGQTFGETLVFNLSREKQVMVHSMESVTSLGALATNPAQVSAILGARYIVSGSIQCMMKQIRVQVELLNAADNSQLYTESIDGTTDSIFDIQTKVVQSILYSVVIRISDEVQASLSAAMPKNPVAATFYLKGGYLYHNATNWISYKQALSMLESAVKADKNFALGRAKLARAYCEVYGNWENDRTWLDKALEEAQAAYEIDPELPESNIALGRVYRKMRRLDEAEMIFLNAVAMRPDLIHAKRELAWIYNALGRYDEAFDILEESITLADQFHDKNLKADLLTDLALINHKRGMFLKSLEFFNDALAIAKENNSDIREALIRADIANAFKRKNNLTLAYKNLNRSLEIVRRIGDKKHEAGILTSLGGLHESKEELKTALDYFNSGLSIAQEIGNQILEATILSNMGRVLGNLGRNLEAVEALQKAAAIRNLTGEKIKEAKTLMALAAVYCDLGDMEKALDTYLSSNKIFYETRDYSSIMAVLLNIGEIYEFKKEYQEAHKYYDQALEYLPFVEQNKYNSFLHLFRGRLFYLQNNISEAIKELSEVVNDESAMPTNLYRSEMYLAICQEIEGILTDSTNAIQIQINELERIGSYPELVEALRIAGEYLFSVNRIELSKKLLSRGFELASESDMKWEKAHISSLLEKCTMSAK